MVSYIPVRKTVVQCLIEVTVLCGVLCSVSDSGTVFDRSRSVVSYASVSGSGTVFARSHSMVWCLIYQCVRHWYGICQRSQCHVVSYNTLYASVSDSGTVFDISDSMV